MSRHVSFRIPASTANLGAGFDALSLALNRYLKVSVSPGERLKIKVHGLDHEEIPTTADNLIYRVAQSTAKRRGRTLPPFHMVIENHIPLSRGLGSSAAAIIAGITCYEILTDDWLSEAELFRCAFEYENHPDNLSAALYGGLIAAGVAEDGTVLVTKPPISGRVAAVAVIPSFELPTVTARSVLPHAYSRKDTVFNLQRSALLIGALTTGDWSVVREAMKDRVHQPYRCKLVPGLEEILEIEVRGLLGVALSGAGPTVFAFADIKHADEVGMAIAAVFAKHKVEATSHVVQIDRAGRFIEL